MISLIQQWGRHRHRSIGDQGLKFGDFPHLFSEVERRNRVRMIENNESEKQKNNLFTQQMHSLHDHLGT